LQKTFWQSNLFAILFIHLLFLCVGGSAILLSFHIFLGFHISSGLQRKAYDLGVKVFSPNPAET